MNYLKGTNCPANTVKNKIKNGQFYGLTRSRSCDGERMQGEPWLGKFFDNIAHVYDLTNCLVSNRHLNIKQNRVVFTNMTYLF